MIDVLAVATTESGSGRTKIFYQMGTNSCAKTPRNDDDRAIDYVPTQLSSDHVLASTAIPVLFPPARIGSPARGRFYVDGGVRLNAPLQPAIDFGAKGIIVVSTDSRRYGTSAAVNIHEWPALQDHVLQMMRDHLRSHDRGGPQAAGSEQPREQPEANETLEATPSRSSSAAHQGKTMSAPWRREPWRTSSVARASCSIATSPCFTGSPP